MTSSRPNRIRFGAYEMDLHTHELWKNGLRIKLVGQPFEILTVLAGRPGELVTREELRAQLWPEDTFVDFNHGLNAAVNKLRDALCDSADDPKFIETLPRRGYRFIAKVESAAPDLTSTFSPTVITPEPVRPVVAQPAAEPAVLPPPPNFSVSDESETEASCTTFWQRVFSGKLRKAVLVGFLMLGATFVYLHVIGPAEVREREAKMQAELAARFQPLTNISDPTKEPAFSPNGVRIAFVREGDSPETSGIFVKGLVEDDMTQLTKSSDDCCPVWSPDGGSIAFSRVSGEERTIFTVPSNGGTEQKLVTLTPGRGELDWSPDAAALAYAASHSPDGNSGISLLKLQDFTSRALTSPVAPESDWGPAFSPDASHLAFVRGRVGGGPYDIMVMDTNTHVSRKLVEGEPAILGSPAWTPDGQSIVFASNRSGSKLWRVSAKGGAPSSLDEVGEPVWNPAVARVGERLAYQKITSPLNLWELGVDKANLEPARVLVSSTTGTNLGAQFSPDGKKLVFLSDRTGNVELWISNNNGSDPIQVTTVHLAGTPRWSPDGKSIAFDVNWKERGGIYVLRTDGGVPRPIVQDASSNVVPSWSHDGRWIYFASNRTGAWQVWKTPLDGGPPVQVTTQGGFAPMESRNASTLYYAKTDGPLPEIWHVPVVGGPETRVSPLLKPGSWASWTEGDKGIYFIAPGEGGLPTLNLLSFADHRIRSLTTLDRFPFWLTISPDGKHLVFDMSSREESHIMIENGFR